jgi:hypothetical protein
VFGCTPVGASKPVQANGTELTGAFSTALLVSAGAGLVVGPLLDRRSPRILMTAGAAAGALLVAGWSRANTVGVRGSYRPAGVARGFTTLAGALSADDAAPTGSSAGACSGRR